MTLDRPLRLGISSCLLGNAVRYDGGHKLDRALRDAVGRVAEWVPVCPEVEYGLPVPREPLRLVGDRAAPRLVAERTGTDHTAGMKAWAARRLDALEREDLCGFVFKSRSPSSGMRRVRVYPAAGGRASRAGVGIFARAFMERFPWLPVEDEERLSDPAIRGGFVERLFVAARWGRFRRSDGTAAGLAAFHTDHRLLVLSRSPRHATALDRMIAGADAPGRRPARTLLDAYAATLFEGLRAAAARGALPARHDRL